MEKKILNDLKEVYFDIINNCESYDYNCRQCPHDKYCDKIADLVVTLNNHYQEEKE